MDERDRLSAKRDRTARFYRVVRFLEARGERGATPEEVARAVDVSKRTVYRDLKAIDEELGLPVWSDDGRFGLEGKGLLPALQLTQPEAMAVFLSARLMARYADEYDPDLAGAFQKIAEGLPEVLAAHVADTLDRMRRLGTEPRDRRAILATLTRAWAERRVVELRYRTGTYDGRPGSRPATVRPYLLEPSLTTRALYLIGHDETRNAVRTFKLERIEAVTLTPRVFEPPDDGKAERALERAWDIVADQPEVEVVVRFASTVASRVRETRWHPSEATEPGPNGSLTWRARVSGTLEVRSWILGWGADAEVLAPAELRTEVAAVLGRAAAAYAPDGR